MSLKMLFLKDFARADDQSHITIWNIKINFVPLKKKKILNVYNVLSTEKERSRVFIVAQFFGRAKYKCLLESVLLSRPEHNENVWFVRAALRVQFKKLINFDEWFLDILLFQILSSRYPKRFSLTF